MLTRSTVKNKALYFFYLLLSIVLLSELVLRVAGEKKGQTIILNGYTISVPRSLEDWEDDLKRYTDVDESDNGGHYYKYDSQLGWTVNPNTTSWDSLYISNKQGIRSRVDFSTVRDSSELRIAVFGDSFTEGYQVNNDETWAHFLNETLNDKNIKSEVLNYGVPGYGVDQAYLRWKTVGYKLNPDIVVLGLHMENYWRNLNTFRPNYFTGAGILLTKPRAVVVGDSLSWKNIPTIEPQNILNDVVMNFNESSLFDYEYFNKTNLYSENILNNSYFYLFVCDLFVSDITTNFNDSQEGHELMWQLIESFAKEVNSKGSKFVILQLLKPNEVQRVKNNQQFDYQNLLDRIIDAYPFCSTENLLKNYDAQDVFETKGGHPNALGNKLIGEHLAQYLIKKSMYKQKNKVQ